MAAPLFGFTQTAAVTYSLLTTNDVTGLTVWLDSSDKTTITLGTGSNVTNWTDKKNNYSFSNTSGSYPTQLSNTFGVNFANGGGCNGPVGLVYFNTWYLPTQNFTVFCVNNPTTTSQYNGAFGFVTASTASRPNLFFIIQNGTQEKTSCLTDYNGSVWSTYISASNNVVVSVGTTRVDELINTSSTATTGIWTNGTLNTYSNAYTASNYTSSYSNYPANRSVLGASSTAWGSRSFTGNIYEVAVYNRALTTTERTNLETYYRLKWMFSPTQYTSNVYWFDAADTSTITASGSNVTAWANKGTANMTYSSNTGTVTTGTATKNGRNVISFTTSSKLVSNSVSLAISGNDETIFLVYQKRANFTTGGGIDLMYAINPDPNGNPDGSFLYYNAIAYGKDLTNNSNYYDMFWTVCGGLCFTAEGNTPTYSPYVYQLLTLQVSANGSSNQGFWFFGGSNPGYGSAPGQYLDGCGYGYSGSLAMTFDMGKSTVDWDIAEYIVYNRVLTQSERQNAEGYLSIKWGIPLTPAHPYSTNI